MENRDRNRNQSRYSDRSAGSSNPGWRSARNSSRGTSQDWESENRGGRYGNDYDDGYDTTRGFGSQDYNDPGFGGGRNRESVSRDDLYGTAGGPGMMPPRGYQNTYSYHYTNDYKRSRDYDRSNDFSDKRDYTSSRDQRDYGRQDDETFMEKVGRFFGVGPKGYTRSDERIREDVCEALYADPDVDASNIEVSVKSGVVTLTGSVESRHDKRSAEQCVEYVTGVKDVSNNLAISSIIHSNGPETTPTPNNLTADTSSSKSKH